MESYIGYALASTLQFRDRLENRRSTNDKMSKRVWNVMEKGKTNKARMAEAEGEREKEGGI